MSYQTRDQLISLEAELNVQYQDLKAQNLKLDITRGKPSADQLSLSDHLDGFLKGNYLTANGEDTRNYGNLRGITEVRKLGADMLNVPADNVIAAGNASLTLMYVCMLHSFYYGARGSENAWFNACKAKMICPVPGYDRHFSLCENLGVEMVTVPMREAGPDMDAVEALIEDDDNIVGLWCVPKYSNPTGVVYSDETVERIAQLGKIAKPWFRVFYDNAYAVHDLSDTPVQLASLWDLCEAHGTQDSVWQFGSTSKITFAGAGVSFVAGSNDNLAELQKLLGVIIIGFDKVNQLRHAKMFPDKQALLTHMSMHAELIRPKFTAVLQALNSELAEYGSWTQADGGYFISFDTEPGLASEVVRLANEAGVKLTPAGATFPYGKDPEDRNIRIAPTLPPLPEVVKAMEVFVNCVKLATVQKKLSKLLSQN
jgi:DNA-binding transcriptional MocR family regulator